MPITAPGASNNLNVISYADTTPATTSTLTLLSGAGSVDVDVGDFLVMSMAIDNVAAGGTAPTIASIKQGGVDIGGWVVVGPVTRSPGATVNDGTSLYIVYWRATFQLLVGSTLVIEWTDGVGGSALSVGAKAIRGYCFGGIDPITPVAVGPVSATGVGIAGSTVIIPTAAGQLVYGAKAYEGPFSDPWVHDTDTTNGVWVLLSASGTADATATNNQTIRGDRKAVTASGSQTWNPTATTSRDFAQMVVVFGVAPVVTGSATLSGSGTLSADGSVTVVASATLTGNGALSDEGVVTRFGDASLSASATLSASAVVTTTGTATLAGVAAFGADGSVIVDASASLVGNGSLSDVGIVTRFGDASLTASGDLAATAATEAFGSAALTGNSSLSDVGEVTRFGEAALVSVGSLGADGFLAVSANGVLSGSAAFMVSGGVISFGSVVFNASATLTAAGDRSPPLAARVTATIRQRDDVVIGTAVQGSATASVSDGG